MSPLIVTTSLDWWSGTACPNAAAGNAITNPTTRASTKNLRLFIKASKWPAGFRVTFYINACITAENAKNAKAFS